MTADALLAVFASFATLLGLVFGSFLNVLILRWPEDRSLLPPSACPRCGHRLGPRDLVPVLSWLVQRGRCRHCGAPISPAYPLIEALTAALAWLAYWRVIDDVADLDPVHLVAWMVLFLFLCLLVVLVFADVRYQLIPDQVTVYAVPLGVLGALALDGLGYTGFPTVSWEQAVLGAAGAGLFFGLLKWLGDAVLGQVGLGLGDVKALAMIGAFVGAVPGAWVVLLVASVVQSVVGVLHLLWSRRRVHLPFGPALGLAAALWVLFGDLWLPLVLPGFPVTAPAWLGG